MIPLAYVDLRSLLFAVGLPVFVLLSLLVAHRVARARTSRTKVVLVSSLVFTALFAFFLTGIGLFVNRTEVREYVMTWIIEPPPPGSSNEPEVVLSFVNFPGHYVTENSSELVDHLRAVGKDRVQVKFEVTSSYGDAQGFRVTEIAGLESWESTGGTAGVTSDRNTSPARSPWD